MRQTPPTPEQKRACYKCLWLLPHPFHDDGSLNEDADVSLWGDVFDWHRDDDGNVTG